MNIAQDINKKKLYIQNIYIYICCCMMVEGAHLDKDISKNFYIFLEGLTLFYFVR